MHEVRGWLLIRSATPKNELIHEIVREVARWCSELFPVHFRASAYSTLTSQPTGAAIEKGQHSVCTAVTSENHWQLSYEFGRHSSARETVVDVAPCKGGFLLSICKRVRDPLHRSLPLAGQLCKKLEAREITEQEFVDEQSSYRNFSEAVTAQRSAKDGENQESVSRSVEPPATTTVEHGLSTKPSLSLRVALAEMSEVRSPLFTDSTLRNIANHLQEAKLPNRIIFVRNRSMHQDLKILLKSRFSVPIDEIERIFKVVDEEYDGKLAHRIGSRSPKGSVILWSTDHLKKPIDLKKRFIVISRYTPRETLEYCVARYGVHNP